MRSSNPCHKGTVLLGLLLGFCGLWGKSAQAVQLNFSATLMPGTCTFNLSQSTVDMGTLMINTFQPATLVAARPFTLSVTNCSGTDVSLTPKVVITGDGLTQDGRWLFRASDSTTSNGIGVMLVKTETMPVYGTPEVKQNDTIDLAPQGVDPANQDISFYAGATCGNGTGCIAVGSGQLIARVLFSLDYR